MKLALLTPEQIYVLKIVEMYGDPYVPRRSILSFVQTSLDDPENPFEKRWLINHVRDALMALEEFNLISVTENGIRLLDSTE